MRVYNESGALVQQYGAQRVINEIELGHATDTTLARVSAGLIAVEGSNVLMASGGHTISGTQKIDVSSATAFVVEDDGVNDNVFVVDTSTPLLTATASLVFSGAQVIRKDNNTGNLGLLSCSAAGFGAYMYFNSSESFNPGNCDVVFGGNRADNADVGGFNIYHGSGATGASTEKFAMTKDYANFSVPLVFINDTANAKMTIGLTINQGANDDEIMSFKSSDVVHGMTNITEASTFGFIQKASATGGGLRIEGITDPDAGTGVGIFLIADIDGAGDDTKSTAAVGAVTIYGRKRSSTTVTAMGTNANLAVISNAGITRFIFDAEGDSHQDVGTAWTNFDAHDDIELLNALSGELTLENDPLKASFGQWMGQHRETLEQAKVVTFNDDGHHFINWSRTHMLEIGAIRQNAGKIDSLSIKVTSELGRLENKLAQTEQALLDAGIPLPRLEM